jgi:hypothetical protein
MYVRNDWRRPHPGAREKVFGWRESSEPGLTRSRLLSPRRNDPETCRGPRIARMRLRSKFIVLALTLLAAACSGGSNLTLNTGPAPWPNPDNVAARIEAAGLPSSSTESLTVHYHSHVDIFVNGKSEPVASSIGRDDRSLFSPLHTHATSGLIHIEAPEDQDFTVGMLFTEWGVRLTNDCIGGYCSPDTKLSAYVDGTSYTQPISTIVLKKGEEIAIVIGSPPPTIPSTWDCLANIDPAIENPAQCADFGEQVPA